jgi:NADP-dependent 3-hydroxy acid dehydrogenase YdfG
MPKGPQGQKRPADVIGNAVHVMRIATGEIEETPLKSAKAKGGKKGGKARAKALTPSQRSEIASAAATARWKKS